MTHLVMHLNDARIIFGIALLWWHRVLFVPDLVSERPCRMDSINIKVQRNSHTSKNVPFMPFTGRLSCNIMTVLIAMDILCRSYLKHEGRLTT